MYPTCIYGLSTRHLIITIIGVFRDTHLGCLLICFGLGCVIVHHELRYPNVQMRV